MQLPEDATELEGLALQLLAIPSVIENEGAIADWCANWAEEHKLYAMNRAGENLALQPREFRPGRKRLLLLGHLDTVPESGANPARLEGGRIYGLGSSDMKCADALILHLLARAVHEEPKHDLIGVLYAREEGPFAGSGLPEIMAAAPGAFAETDLVIAMEPTDNRLELGCLGTMHTTVRFEGQRAHSARPWQGRNALHMAAPLLMRVAAHSPRDVEFHGLGFREVISATMLDYEGARNVVPGSCTVNLNFRFGPDREMDEACAYVEELIAEAIGEEWIREELVTWEHTDICPSGKVCGDNELLTELETAAGDKLERAAKQAWTDVGRLSQYGLDAINFGPGTTAQAHQVGEWAERSKLEEARILLESWLFGNAGE
jgi:succinyl-diaminopimelate desuccinylase